MKSYTYPAIFVKDEDNQEYKVFFPDLQITTDGRFLEEAYLYAKASLKAYFVYVEKYDLDYNLPTSFDEVKSTSPSGSQVLLVDADVYKKDLK